MTKQILGAALAAFLLLIFSGVACGDVIILKDGKVLPSKVEKEVDPNIGPSNDDLRKSGKTNLDLAYDKIKVSGKTVSASFVDAVFITTALTENAYFNDGELQGQSGYWEEAATSFGQAADQLKGVARQQALYKRAMCLANLGNAGAFLKAADALIAEYPKTYWLAPVQEVRARILIQRRQTKQAKAVLDGVINAPGMNARDLFEARLTKVYLFDYRRAGKDIKKYEATQKKYQAIVSGIDSDFAAKTEAKVQRMKGLVGIGKCLIYQQKPEDARKYFDQVISNDDSLVDKVLLASAYSGLGDVLYLGVKKELGTNPPAARLAQILETLTDAALYYMRVTRFYREFAGDDLYGSTVSCARVLATQFKLGGDKDCALGKRAREFFYEAHKMLRPGEDKRLLTIEVKEFLASWEEACKVPEEPAKDN